MILSFFHWYGLLICVGILIGVMVIKWQSRYYKINPNWIEEALPFIFVFAVLGARIYHLATDWQLYQEASLLDLIALWNGGLGFLGAIMGGIVGFLIWRKRKSRHEASLFGFLDLFAFAIPLAQSVGRIGNYLNQELYGMPTNLPWGILINGTKYHPLFAYEIMGNLVLFLLLLLLSRKRLLVWEKGQYASLYLFGYGFLRFWLEFLRPETATWSGTWGMLSIAQWWCLGLMILGTVLFWVRRHYPKKEWDWSLE